MKQKGGKKTKSQLYSNIGSAVIPSASIVAVPSVGQVFPRQKFRSNEEWGPLASNLLHAATTSQVLLPTTNALMTQHTENYAQRAARQRLDTSAGEEESDDELDQQRQQEGVVHKTVIKGTATRSYSISDAEKRLFGHVVDDEDSNSTTRATTLATHLDAKHALTAELSRSANDNVKKHSAVSITRQRSPPVALNPVQSSAAPISTRTGAGAENAGVESKSTTTARSSLNDTTTVPASARSVSFKEPVIDEDHSSSSSSRSPQTATIVAVNTNSVAKQLVLPPPDEYQENVNELERRNELLNDEVQQLRLNNQNLHNQYDQLFQRLQTSQKLSQLELTDLLKQSGRDQTKGLENLNKTLQNRCDQLENELIAVKDRYEQSRNQSNLRELKTENHFLKDYIHRLNAASSDYQTTHPPKTLKKQMKKEQNKLQGLPEKGPPPIWLLDQKFLSPLFVCYDEKLNENKEFIKNLQAQVKELHEQAKSITDENISLHERMARSSSLGKDDSHLSDIDHIKRQAYLVLEENKVLQEHLDLQSNRLNDVQKSQIHEVSNLTRRLMIVENEKTEGDRILEEIRLRNEDLKRKYDLLMLDNHHRIHVQEHVHEISEMKRLTDELSEKHAHEMQSLLRRVQDAETAKKVSQLKLTENRSENERLKGEIKAMKRLNKKLDLRVQTFEKKLVIQQVKEQKLTNMIEATNEELEKTKLERDTYAALAATKEEETNRLKALSAPYADKLAQLDELIESYKNKNKNKERVSEGQEQIKRQNDGLRLQSLEQEQRIQQLASLLNEKQVVIDTLNAEKKKLELDLEAVWQATHADGMRIREQLLDMRLVS